MTSTPTDAISTAHGVDVVYSEYGDLIRAAKPIGVGIASRGVPDTLVHRRIDPRGWFNGTTNVHDTTAAQHLKRFGGDKFLLVEAINGTPKNDPGHFETLKRLWQLIDEWVPVITEPFASKSLLGMQGPGSLKKKLDAGNTIYACEYHTEASTPAMVCTIDDPRPWPHTIVGFETNGPYNRDLAGAVVKTGAASWAGPIIASGAALLRLIDRNIPATAIVSAILDTAAVTSGKRFMRLDLAARELFGARSVPAPVPEPEPQPEPQPTMDIFTSPHSWNSNRGEGLEQGFDRDTDTKALAFRTEATIGVQSDKQLVTGIRVVTANDVPDRDIATITLRFRDGLERTVTAPFTEERFHESVIPVQFDGTRLKEMHLVNRGNSRCIQFAELELIAGEGPVDVEEPEPDPVQPPQADPITEPEPLTLEERVKRIEDHLGL